MGKCKVCKVDFIQGNICDDCLEDETLKEVIQNLSDQRSVNVDQRVSTKVADITLYVLEGFYQDGWHEVLETDDYKEAKEFYRYSRGKARLVEKKIKAKILFEKR